ncbi:MAG: DUF4824 family protein [Halarcobacter sp.]
MESEQFNNSRFFTIDARINPKILRNKYKDKTKFIIAKGLIRVNYINENEEMKVNSYISFLSIKNIYIPLVYLKLFENNDKYLVDLKYGKILNYL